MSAGSYGKPDAVQGPIVEDLRKAGFPVFLLSAVGKGCPDVLTRHKLGHLVLIEFKTPKGYTKRRTRELQEAFARVFPVVRCSTSEDAFRAVGLL